MARFELIHIARSDGKFAIKAKSGHTEENRPVKLGSGTGADEGGKRDYYIELVGDHEKLLDWKKKLGAMLVKYVANTNGGVRDGRSFMLSNLPYGYRLYEHVKTGEGRGQNRSSDRQDAYLYGHPDGPTKRYRSPAEFFPHLCWLATEESGDPQDCRCKICCPWEESRLIKDGHFTKEQLSVEAVKGGSGGRSSITAQPPTRAPRPPTSAMATVPEVVIQLPKPTPFPLIQSQEQRIDVVDGRFIYRSGELIWARSSVSWTLAIVIKRQSSNTSTRPSQWCTVQRLCHPFGELPSEAIDDQRRLRPWLTWRLPDPQHVSLRQPGYTFENVDWRAVLSGKFGDGDSEVDSSIFAARAIDATYSLFGSLDTGRATADTKFWNGVYVGAEKIWRGDVVRLRYAQGGRANILIVHDIIEKFQRGFGTTPVTATVQLVGDVYTCASVPSEADQLPHANPALPERLCRDLEYCNSVARSAGKTVYRWKLIRALHPLGLEDILGRWYETSMLLPLLESSDEIAARFNAGDFGDIYRHFTVREYPISVPKVSRLRALGKAVPPYTQISEAVDGPEQEDQYPAETEMTGVTQEIGDIDQYMNLDGEE